MTRNLDTADKIVKLGAASLTVVLYFLDLIEGPFAVVLTILSLLVIAIYATRAMIENRN